MKTSTKVIIGVSVLALAATAYYMKKKKDAKKAAAVSASKPK